MSKKQTSEDFFNEEMAQAYDERNDKLSPIKDAVHFAMGLILKDLPENSKVLCVGAGTGGEIIFLSKKFPKWTFVALEPSESMLTVCKKRLEKIGIADRCSFVHGYIEDAPANDVYDAVISLFVGHFVEHKQRINFFQNMIKKLCNGGYLVHAEISFDLDSKQFPYMLDKWKEVQKLMGGTDETLQKLPDQLKNILTVLPPDKTEDQIRQGGLDCPVRFFQALMICGWFGKKN